MLGADRVPKFISGAERNAEIPMVSQTLFIFVTLCNCETNDYDDLVPVLKKNWLDIESKHTRSKGQGKFVVRNKQAVIIQKQTHKKYRKLCTPK